MKTLIALSAIALCCAGPAGCSSEDAEMKVAGGPRPNGVAEMKPTRALALARRVMSELDDAVYETTTDVEIGGVTKRFEVVETVTQDGCARVMSHPRLGQMWMRVIGPTMYLRTNDKAADAIGRTPAQVELFRGRWLKLRAPELVRGCDLEYLLPTRRDAEFVRATGLTKVDGAPGRRFHASGGGLSVTFVIATSGRPLLMSSRTTGDPGVVAELPNGLSFDGTSVLTDVNTGADVEPPPERLVIDPADFQTVPA